ncbi:hypothetical protein [uncultured Friedmanniella sp.]|uniref:hypothetical protein n=1 Tax=uncultured Friedmanniella sp. TaxID=335381 RepID=UPI0035CB8FC0
MHSSVAVRGAGLGPATGILFALPIVVVITGGAGPLAGLILALALASALLGLLEDLRGLPVGGRAAGQLVLGVTFGLGLCSLLGRSPWWTLLVAAAVVAYVNAANFMDGIDGISALHGIVAGLHYMVVGTYLGLGWIQGSGLVVAAAFLAFAPWNLHHRVFLGDVGSYLLGGSVVGCAAALWLATGEGFLAAAPTLVYLADTGVTLLVRLRRREPLLQAHRSHVYQRLVLNGLTHLQGALLVATLSAVCCAAAFWAASEHRLGAPLVLVGVVLLAYQLAPARPLARSVRR